MKSNALLVAVVLAGTTPLRGQTVVAPPPKLDSTQTAVRDVLYRLRDSLQLVDAASARIARDRAMSSDMLMRSRAYLLATRCASAARAVAPARSAIISAGLPRTDRLALRAALLRSLDSLDVGLASCVTEFKRLQTPERAAELRDYGIGRGKKVQLYIRHHDAAVGPFFQEVAGSRYEANRQGAGSIASPR